MATRKNFPERKAMRQHEAAVRVLRTERINRPERAKEKALLLSRVKV